MSRARTQQSFQTVRSEGGLLPIDILQRIGAQDKELPGLTPDAYHLPPGGRFGEAISGAWSRVLASWRNFQDALARLPENDPATTLTREKFLLPLFEELKFGRLPKKTSSFDVDGRSYAISHEYHRSPIHMLGCRVSLEDRVAGLAGAAKSSPHGLVQDLLNRSEQHLWGFVTNGLLLRILRDHHSLTQQAYVEFDLQAMLDGEHYSDFVLLWLLCHQSRIEAERPEECWLERWMQAARDEGISALDKLRIGVEQAIAALGTGFIKHPRNAALKADLHSGDLDKQDYFRELRNLVYRCIFLFVAEDRGVLLDPNAPAEARARYDRFYSTRKLRTLSDRRRGGPHGDLWQGLRLVMDKLYEGCPELGLPALGSFLWSAGAVANLRRAECANEYLLAAVRALCFFTKGNLRFLVNWRQVGADELGSIFESLLELHPRLNQEAGTFELDTAAGHERKTTGSYYTPSSLVDCLLDSALDPVVDAAVAKKSRDEAERALLNLKVCDPACGSGHFLVAAARRIAKRLAAVRTGDDEPSPTALQHALRDVVGHCIFGVDVNKMAVELCRVALWMEAIEPGRPLSFLDNHIQHGNSLLGATPALLKKGIPDDAFDAIEGDDKEVAKRLKKRNRDFRKKGQTSLESLLTPAALPYTKLTAEALAVEEDPDDALPAVRKKESDWQRFTSSQPYQDAQLLCDLWCAAFMWPKQPSELEANAPTDELWLRATQNPQSIPAITKREVRKIAQQYSFFHWHLAFPQVFRQPEGDSTNEPVGWSGGFDVVLGNPPWDTLSPDQREFFGQYRQGIRALAPDVQALAIAEMQGDSSIASAWQEHCHLLYTVVHFLKSSGRFVLFAEGNLGKGDFNVFRMFVEHALFSCKENGYIAQIVPGTFYGGANASEIRKYIFDRCQLKNIYVSNSRRGWFAAVDLSRLCIFAVQRGGRTGKFNANFGMQSIADLSAAPTEVDADFIRQQSPETYTIPDVRSTSDVNLNEKLMGRFAPFGNRIERRPFRHYQREIDMGNDRDLFSSDPTDLPLYEGRMIWQFDHRAKCYTSGHGHSSSWEELKFGNPRKCIGPQWRIPVASVPKKLGNRIYKYRVSFRDVAQPRDERSLIAALVPPNVICGHKVPTIVFEDSNNWAYLPWLAIANSLTMDWLVRMKLSSPSVSYTLMDSLPFPPCTLETPWVRAVAPLVLNLVCTAPEMTDYWNAMAQYGFCEPVARDCVPNSALINEELRAAARAEIDALVAFQVFNISRSELEGILDTFPLLKKKEEKLYKEFRTRRLVLERYDAIAASVAKGDAYSPNLPSNSAELRVAHPSAEPQK